MSKKQQQHWISSKWSHVIKTISSKRSNVAKAKQWISSKWWNVTKTISSKQPNVTEWEQSRRRKLDRKQLQKTLNSFHLQALSVSEILMQQTYFTDSNLKFNETVGSWSHKKRRYIIAAKCKAFGSFLHDQFSFAQVAKEKNGQKLSNIFSLQLVNLVTPARHGSN